MIFCVKRSFYSIGLGHNYVQSLAPSRPLTVFKCLFQKINEKYALKSTKDTFKEPAQE